MVRGDAASVALAASALRSQQAAALPEPAKKKPNPDEKVASGYKPAKSTSGSPNRRLSFNFLEMKSSCPAHPSRSKSYANLASDALASNLRPCLRHKRLISHSCDDLLANSSLSKRNSGYKSGTVSSNVSVCSGSIGSSAGKTVKFLLPEKKSSVSGSFGSEGHRFSSSTLVPSSAYRWAASAGMPYYNKYWQNFGAQFLFGQNLDRYLWTNVCCPCYQCYHLPYSYSFGHFSSQYSLTRPSRVKSVERIPDSQETDSANCGQKGIFSHLFLLLPPSRPRPHPTFMSAAACFNFFFIYFLTRRLRLASFRFFRSSLFCFFIARCPHFSFSLAAFLTSVQVLSFVRS